MEPHQADAVHSHPQSSYPSCSQGPLRLVLRLDEAKVQPELQSRSLHSSQDEVMMHSPNQLPSMEDEQRRKIRVRPSRLQEFQVCRHP